MWIKKRSKLCGGCGVIVFEFPFSRCLQCRQKDEVNMPNVEFTSSRLKYINEQKSSKPCTDCNILYPYYVMDFDHLPEYKKEFGIGNSIILKKSIDAIKKEMEKCDLVCSNCHRIRTYNRSKKFRNKQNLKI